MQAVAIAYRDETQGLVPFVDEDEFLPHLLHLLAVGSIEAELVFCPPTWAGRLDRHTLAQHTRSQIVAALERRSVSELRRA